MRPSIWFEPGKFDEDLKQRVAAFLSGAARSALRQVDIDVTAGEVILRGRVPSYYEKQLAQEYARRVAGVFRVMNLLKVGSIDSPPSAPETVPANRFAAKSISEFGVQEAASKALAVGC